LTDLMVTSFISMDPRVMYRNILHDLSEPVLMKKRGGTK
jgi:hypothetical protein